MTQRYSIITIRVNFVSEFCGKEIFEPGLGR